MGIEYFLPYMECRTCIFCDLSAGFLRILGFRKQSGAIWKFFQPSVRAQLITQTSQAYDHLTGIGLDIYNADLHASRLYRQILKCRSQSFLPDITSEPVIILP